MLHEPLIVRGHEQPDLWLLADLMKPLIGGNDTNGKFAVAVNRIHPGGGPPPHVHANDDEAFFILEGEVTFLLNDKLVIAKPGDFVWAPRGVPHCFKCTSGVPSKFVLIVTPAAFSEFADALGKPALDFAAVPAVENADIAKLMEVAPQFGITMLPTHPMPATPPVPMQKKASLWVMGERVTMLATSEKTAGQFTIADIVTAPAGGPPLHAHTREDELFYIVDGRHEVTIGDRVEIAGPGDLICVPRGTRHRYTNVDAMGGRLLSVHTPGGFESFFNEVGVDASEHATTPTMTPPPPDALAALLARHGMTA